MNRRTILKLTGLAVLDAFVGGCNVSGADDAAAKGPATQESKTVKVYVFNRKGELVGPVEQPKVVKTDAQWKAAHPRPVPHRPGQGDRGGVLRESARQP